MADFRTGGQNSSTERMIYYLLSEMHCVKPGKISTFDKDTNLAEVRPVVKIKVWDNEEPDYKELPILLRVPVIVFCSAEAGLCITHPVREGDPCVILFADTMLDNFINQFAKGGCSVAPECCGGDNKTSVPRIHDLTDGMCIVGLRGIKDAIPHWNNEAIELRNYDRTAFISLNENCDITIKTIGGIAIQCDKGMEIESGGDIVINGATVNVNEG